MGHFYKLRKRRSEGSPLIVHRDHLYWKASTYRHLVQVIIDIAPVAIWTQIFFYVVEIILIVVILLFLLILTNVMVFQIGNIESLFLVLRLIKIESLFFAHHE